MSQVLPVTGEDVEAKRQQLLAALAALPAVGVGVDKPLLREIQERDPEDWEDEHWDAANARELLTPDLKAQYAIRLLQRKQEAERAELLAQYQGGNIPGTGVATRGSVSTADLLAGQVPVREGTQGERTVEETDEPYQNWKADELREEVRLRNESRAEDEQIVPASNRKEDLAAALEQDDQRAS